MPAWAWWVLISGGLCLLSWLYGRLSRPHAPAGNGPWEASWAVYFSPNGGAAHAILNGIRSAQHTILVQAYLLHSTRLAGALVRAHQRGVQVHVILDANAQPHDPPVTAVALLVGAGIAVSLDDQHEWAHDKVMISGRERSSSPAPIIGRSPQRIRMVRTSWSSEIHNWQRCMPRIGSTMPTIASYIGARSHGGHTSVAYGSPSHAGAGRRLNREIGEDG